MLYSVHLLRFFAAAVVVISHASNVLHIPKPNGHPGDIGVDIFFVISGLVIGLSTRDGDPAVNFAFKRFVRVVPAYWLATLALTAFLYATNTVGVATGTQPNWNDMWLSLTFLAPVTPTFLPIVFPGWTLSYELMFYAIYGVTLLLFQKRVSVICMIIVGALVAAGRIPNLCIEFVFGLALSMIAVQLKTANKLIGFACIALTAAFLYTTPLGSSQAVSWGIPSVLLIVGVMQFEQVWFLKNRLCVVLGDASYAIYLFHIMLMLIGREAANALGISWSDHLSLTRAALIILAVVGGIAIDILIVGPMTNGLKNLFLKRNAPRQPAVSSTP